MVKRSGAAEAGKTRDNAERFRIGAIAARVLARGAAVAVALVALAVAAPVEAADPLVEALRRRVEALRADGDAQIGAGSIAAHTLVASLYERRGFAPLWSDPARARSLLDAIEASATHGLDPRDYHAVQLAAAPAPPANDADRVRAAAQRELLQTDAFVRLAYHLYFGKADPRSISGAWNFARTLDRIDPVTALDELLAEGDSPHVFDAALEGAVRRFQSRHGLEADGIVGRATLAALNVGVAERIAQVRANLERLRWVARELAGDYLLVDIAGFNAQPWLSDAPVWSARVVVGKPFRKTPEFRARMKYLVLNPEWSVPPTILREDVLPKVIADPAYLERHRMRVLDAAGQRIDAAAIDWASYRANPRAFPYQIVQAPGGDNPLGAIKFMFPNEHAVYLHDTPARALFERTMRAFSSGCIRVERPLELARLLLDDPVRWSEEKLREAVASGTTLTVPVRHAVQVLLLYFTAQVTADGRLHFRPDLYRRVRAIVAALAAPLRFAPVDAGRRSRPADQGRGGRES